MKKSFEKDSGRLKFSFNVDGKERTFEFYYEPFEGALQDNVETFSKWFQEGDTRKKFFAINLLAQAKVESAIPTLIAAVKLPGFPGRATAAAGLAHFKGNKKVLKTLLSALESADYLLTTVAISSLGALGMKKAVKPLRKILFHCLDRPELFSNEPTAAPAALIAVCAIDALLSLGCCEFAEEIVPFFEHPHWAVKHRATQSAAKNPHPMYISALKRLSQASEIPLRIGAAEALVRNNDSDGYDSLLNSAKSADYTERATAIAVIGTLTGERIKHILSELLKGEKDLHLRMEIAIHLARLGGEIALTDFKTAIEDESPFVRLSAISHLSNLLLLSSPLSGAARQILLAAETSEPDEFLRSQIHRGCAKSAPFLLSSATSLLEKVVPLVQK